MQEGASVILMTFLTFLFGKVLRSLIGENVVGFL